MSIAGDYFGIGLLLAVPGVLLFLIGALRKETHGFTATIPVDETVMVFVGALLLSLLIVFGWPVVLIVLLLFGMVHLMNLWIKSRQTTEGS